jgi:hypothetical protein
MGSTGALMAIGVLIGFLGGVMVGVILIVSAAYRREDRHYSIDDDAPDKTCRGTRRISQTWVLGKTVKPAGYRPRTRAEDDEDEDDDDNRPSWPGRGYRN